MKTCTILAIIILNILLISCTNEPSLQKYYVKNQKDKRFIAIDIPVNFLMNDNFNEELETLGSIEKILAYPLETTNPAGFMAEERELGLILEDVKYQLLMKYNSGNKRAEIYFTREEDAINEVVIFGIDEELGLGVARVSGKKMHPDEMKKLLKSLENNDLNINGLQELVSVFKRA